MTPIMQGALTDPQEPAEDAGRRLRAAGVADGHPIVPPTAERVQAFCGLAGCNPEGVVAVLGASGTPVTAFDVAVNAVMAGCEASHLPLLAAAVEAAADARFNVAAMLATRQRPSMVLLASGPAARRLSINAGVGCLAGDAWPNAAIGRAFSLTLKNVARAGSSGPVGEGLGPGICFAEDEARSPWPAFHADRGLGTAESAVTVFAIAGAVEIVSDGAAGADEILQTVARSMTIAGTVGERGLLGGGEPLVVLPAEQAVVLQSEGFDKGATRRELWRRARLRLRDLAAATRERIEAERRAQGDIDPEGALAVALRSADISLVVGGSGDCSTYLPGWRGGTRSATRTIRT